MAAKYFLYLSSSMGYQCVLWDQMSHQMSANIKYSHTPRMTYQQTLYMIICIISRININKFLYTLSASILKNTNNKQKAFSLIWSTKFNYLYFLTIFPSSLKQKDLKGYF